MLPSPALPTDLELVERVRAGDTAAFAGLYQRHRPVAHRLALRLAGPAHADDLVSEAFARTLRLLRAGSGPDSAFRAYLCTAVRRVHYNNVSRDRTVPVEHVNDGLLPSVADPWPELVEQRLVAAAVATLPERWQQVLRLTVVEGRPPAEVAGLLGISPHAVAQLSFRAREALRLAYLELHVPEPTADRCRPIPGLLARQARGQQGRRDRVDAHLAGCEPCRSAQEELVHVAGTLHPAGRR